ncbi:hypothetical protein HJC23_008344 [Cyclotella cryptica]|uniref:UBA domain-containing protein n=1 Tax=Cyclotella cryptica TaxID=29204 RepID=A0ABD3Q5P3_9STRA|eukprot:CCRYP_008627-RA/>CCRYP_008627-RA protein AED:0.33 eAED:0.33 QI:0/-1/0/1/-1/1/1/0/801
MTLTNVSAGAAEWIAQFLNNHDDFYNRNCPREAAHVADLNDLSGENVATVLFLNNCLDFISRFFQSLSSYRTSVLFTVKELKCIAKEIKKQTGSTASTGSANVIYSMPLSGSRKAEWVSSVANAFASTHIMNIMTSSQITGVAVARSSTAISPRVESRPSSGVKASERESTGEEALAAAMSSTVESQTRLAFGRIPRRIPRRVPKRTTPIESASTSNVNSVAVTVGEGKEKQSSNSKSPPRSGKKSSPRQKSQSKQNANNSSIEAEETLARRSFSSFGTHHDHMPYSFHQQDFAPSMASTAASPISHFDSALPNLRRVPRRVPKRARRLELASTANVKSVAVTVGEGKAKQSSNSKSPPSSGKTSPRQKSESKRNADNSSIEAEEAMTRRSQEHCMYNSLSSFGTNYENMTYSFHPSEAASTAAASFASAISKNGSRERDSWRRPAESVAASAYAAPNGMNLYGPVVERPYSTETSSGRNSIPKVKVKIEPKSSSTLSSVDDSLRPRDYRESAMVESLRNMGFTDMREMLSGIRATSTTDAEGECVFLPHQWNFQQQTEAAMMWIVNQREEAAEARKLDEARVSSEMVERAMKQLRREENERRLRYADLKDLYGSVEMGSKEVESKHFPCSVLLKNFEVRKILHAIGTGPGKDEGIRLLQLEGKAKNWYGTVLPFAHFKYVVCPRFEKWSKKFISSSKELDSSSTSILIKHVANESKKLEQGMYNLSEQEMGSFGMAPKLFLLAQKDAEASGKSLCNEASNDIDDDEVEIVSAADVSGCLPSLHRSTKRGRKKTIEIIDLC